MGTRINLLFPHDLPDWSDRPRILEILASSLPAARSVEAYWLQNGQSGNLDEPWKAEPPFPPPLERDYSRFSGPGPLFIEVNPHAVRVRTGGRWRGFLSIAPLRSVHILAFQSLLRSFQATTARCFLDCDFLLDMFWESGDYNACCQLLDQQYGPAIPLKDEIDPELATQSNRNCPLLQYILKSNY